LNCITGKFNSTLGLHADHTARPSVSHSPAVPIAIELKYLS
jgi:hypothetical protein